MWECGLKHKPKQKDYYPTYVTPYVGVWIETIGGINNSQIKKSLLMWECGLKLHGEYQLGLLYLSLLMWECGLKHIQKLSLVIFDTVTPYVGVWIETLLCYARILLGIVTPYVGVWIETCKDA